MQDEKVTLYRPVTETQTSYVTSLAPVNQLGYEPGRVRNRLQFLRPGYYPDAAGNLGYRTGGLYWVPQQGPGSYQVQTSLVPTLTPQQTTQTRLVPETITRQRPVEVTRYVDSVETRRVPVTTEVMSQQVVTEKVPVEVEVPVQKQVVRKVPYEKEVRVPREVTKTVPYTVTTYETVETVEPFEERVLEYVAETSEKLVPRTVRKRIPVETTEMVPVTTYTRVPVDAQGYPVSRLQTVEPFSSGGRVVDANLQVVERTAFPSRHSRNP